MAMASARAASPRQADVDYDVFAEGAYSLDVGGFSRGPNVGALLPGWRVTWTRNNCGVP